MKRVFADTSFFVAMLVPADAAHQRAIAWIDANPVQIVTSEYVLIELGNFLAARGARRLFAALAARLERDARTRIVAASRTLYRPALDLYSSRGDKEWSMTDCLSFVIMGRLKIRDALTGDRHFEQAGFNAVLR